MKSFASIFVVLVIAVCIYAHSSEESRESHGGRFKKCKKEVGITEGRPQGPPNLDDPKEQCFHACLLRESGKLVDGKIVVEEVLNFHKRNMPYFDDDDEEKVNYCVETANEKSDECEVAGTLIKCLIEKVGPPPPPPRHHH